VSETLSAQGHYLQRQAGAITKRERIMIRFLPLRLTTLHENVKLHRGLASDAQQRIEHRRDFPVCIYFFKKLRWLFPPCIVYITNSLWEKDLKN
jgi:hypothetical protein